MPTPSWTVSFITPTASNSPAKACAGHEANRTRRLDQPPSPVTQIHRPARLATRATSSESAACPCHALQRTQIIRHVAELSDHFGVAEIAGGRITGAAECDC